MSIMFATLLAYVGAVLAGLLAALLANAVADRVTSGEPAWNARHCRKCLGRLPVPAALTLHQLLRGPAACPQCQQRGSLRRPLIELGMALLYPLLLVHLSVAGGTSRLPLAAIFAIDALVLAFFAAIFAIDLEHHLIYDLAILPPSLLLLVLGLVFQHRALAAMIFGAIISGGLFLLFYIAGWLLYRQEALGFGDVTLAALVGLLIGYPGISTALLLTVVFAGAISVLLLGIGNVSRRTYIPFGTFLTAGAALTLLLTRPIW